MPDTLTDLKRGCIALYGGDSRDILKTLADNSVDAVVTDPPYALKFMGKCWDIGEIVHDVKFWCECLRVLKPGGHLVSFGGTRTYHRMVVAVEDAGFEIRDQLQWLYGSGFPKSHNHLKPANEPIVLARKPLSEKTVAANVLAHGTGAINVDGCRVRTESTIRHVNGANRQDATQWRTGQQGAFVGGSESGRWPANVLHDGSDEVVGAFPQANHKTGGAAASSIGGTNGIYSGGESRIPVGYDDSGSAARFFYSAKASEADRAGSKHPTVKPIKLMQWLCRLVTPPGGIVLDPFAGSGTTGEAALAEGFRVILIEREKKYLADIKRRLRRTERTV